MQNTSQFDSQPINKVKWVHIDEINANDYNPNHVAKTELKLLYISILEDGFTQPLVTVYDIKSKKYIIIDGFHRYLIVKNHPDIATKTDSHLPVVILKKSTTEQMASTIRHNRARGKHQINGMSNLIFKMLENGWSDLKICNQLGMDAEEILRLKHITGYSKLFENHEYKMAWESEQQIKLRRQKDEDNKKADK